jgi:DNA-binding transcriptional ArsR family regulator
MSHKATNWAIQQRGLKPATKLVLFYLADRHNPDHGCFPSHETLATDCEMSERSVSTHLDKLEDAGLILRSTGRRAGGLWGHTRYMLGFEAGFTPRVADIAGGDGLQVLQAPVADIASDGLQVLHTNLVSTTPVREPCKIDTSFAEFWTHYPRKIGRAAAAKAFAKAAKKHKTDDILFGLSQQIDTMKSKDQQFIPHAATWLNAERWTDEPEQPNDTNARTGHGIGSGTADAFASVAADMQRRQNEGR